MTVATTNNRVSYAGNGATTVFSFPNRFLSDADIVVLQTIDATGVTTPKTLTTHYTLTGAGAASGGNVTMLVAPPTGQTLSIYRNPALTQVIDLINGDPLNVETGVERGLDASALIAQRNRDLLERAIRIPDADAVFVAADMILPDKVTRANKNLGFDAGGKLKLAEITGISWKGAWSGATAYVISDAIQVNGSAYICILGHTNFQPPNATYWNLLAAKGATGTGVMVWLGAWSGATAYVANDGVSIAGASYICILGNTNQSPPNATYWNLLADKGGTGATGTTGATGPTGPDGIVWKGAWSGATTYIADDAVASGGNSYICILGHTNNVPPNATYWTVIASKGDTGAAGSTGATGPTGAKGLAWKGAWSGATTYVIDDAVERSGSSYMCVLGHTNVTPPNATYWQLLAQIGSTGANGSNGTDGINAGIKWLFDTSTTMADPGAGDMRLNHATLASVTGAVVSANNADSGNPDISDFVVTWDDSTTTVRGHLLIRKISAPHNFALYSITGSVTDNSTWLQMVLAHVSSSGSFAAADPLSIQFIRSGDKGTDGIGAGDVVGPASSTNSRIALFDGVSGKLIKQAAETVASFDPAGTGAAEAAVVNTNLLTGAVTMTNKRVVPRNVTTAAPASPYVPNFDTYDQVTLTGINVAFEISAPTYTTANNGERRIMRLMDNATSRALTWNAIYRAVDVTLPAATVISTTLYLEMVYNATDTKWDVVDVSVGDLLAANNLSDVASAATSRTNLGLAIGTNVQAYDAGLLSLAALATAGDKIPYTTAADVYAEAAFTATGRSILDDTTVAAVRTTVGVGMADFMVLHAAGGKGTTTAGCGGPTQVETTTNDVNYWTLEYDTATEEAGFWAVQLPENYDAGTVTAKFYWTNAAGLTTETVRFGIKARCYGDDDALDQAFGAEVTVDDTWLAQGDQHISAESAAITIGGTPAAGKMCVFNVARKVAGDNLTGDARLMMVRIKYTVTQLGV